MKLRNVNDFTNSILIFPSDYRNEQMWEVTKKDLHVQKHRFILNAYCRK